MRPMYVKTNIGRSAVNSISWILKAGSDALIWVGVWVHPVFDGVDQQDPFENDGKSESDEEELDCIPSEPFKVILGRKMVSTAFTLLFQLAGQFIDVYDERQYSKNDSAFTEHTSEYT